MGLKPGGRAHPPALLLPSTALPSVPTSPPSGTPLPSLSDIKCMEKILVKGDWYTVTTATTCTITAADGKLLATAEPGKQCTFKATTERILFSDDNADVQANPKFAPAFGDGGGTSIKFDTTPTKDSTNAVTSGGVYSVLFKRDQNIGVQSNASASYSSAFGGGANATGFGATAIGFWAQATQLAVTAVGEHASGSAVGATVLGGSAQVTKVGGMALGRKVINKDEQAMVLGTLSANDATQTLFYIIGAGSPLATTYEDGEACLGYVVKESNGNILACGTRKLSELLTNNTNFAPAALDLDAPAPTPFLPTGITDPIEMEEELTD